MILIKEREDHLSFPYGKPKKWYYAFPFVAIWLFVLYSFIKILVLITSTMAIGPLSRTFYNGYLIANKTNITGI
jgi:hypothetical protein